MHTVGEIESYLWYLFWGTAGFIEFITAHNRLLIWGGRRLRKSPESNVRDRIRSENIYHSRRFLVVCGDRVGYVAIRIDRQ